LTTPEPEGYNSVTSGMPNLLGWNDGQVNVEGRVGREVGKGKETVGKTKIGREGKLNGRPQ